MKKIVLISSFISLIFLTPYICRGQDTTLNLSNFLNLIDKVNDNQTLSGSFIYKGYPVDISESTQYKTVIGKFKQICWQNKKSTLGPSFTAVYHTKLGYMTRSLFHSFVRQFGSNYKDYKITDDKYCKDEHCVELLTTKEHPIIITYPRAKTDIQEIK